MNRPFPRRSAKAGRSTRITRKHLAGSRAPLVVRALIHTQSGSPARQRRASAQIVEFVQLAEVDPIYFETSFYAAPERGGERAYGLLLAALRTSGLVGIAQVA